MSTPALKTRKPTGKPSWPITLLAGAEKTGKSYSAAKATSSPLIGRTLWITIGEDQPDEYGLLGDFDIVEHDGTYRGILDAVRGAAIEPAPPTGVPLLVVDSMTRLWDLITGNAQEVANQRAKRKGRGSADSDAQITMDLWNAAKDQWTNVMDAVRSFPGPVILTARLDVVAVMNEAGQPTPQKTTKVQAHKSLPFDVGAIFEMPARGETWLTGLRSVRLQLAERTRMPKGFTLDDFWHHLGLEGDDTTAREHASPRVDGDMSDGASPVPTAITPRWDPVPWEDAIAEAGSGLGALRKVWDDAAERGVLDQPISNGEPLRAFLTKVVKRAQQDQAAA